MKGGAYRYAIDFKRAPIQLHDPMSKDEKFSVMRAKTLECIQNLQTWIKSEKIEGVTFINEPGGITQQRLFTVTVKMPRAAASAIKKAPNVHKVTMSTD